MNKCWDHLGMHWIRFMDILILYICTMLLSSKSISRSLYRERGKRRPTGTGCYANSQLFSVLPPRIRNYNDRTPRSRSGRQSISSTKSKNSQTDADFLIFRDWCGRPLRATSKFRAGKWGKNVDYFLTAFRRSCLCLVRWTVMHCIKCSVLNDLQTRLSALQ